MGSGQATTAGHTATPTTTSLSKDYIFPGTALPTGQPVINHYIQACIAYGSVISFSSKSQYGGGATTTIVQQQRPTSGPISKGKGSGTVLGRRRKVKPSLGVEGCMRLRQYSYLSPLGSLKPLGSGSGGGGNGGSGGSNGGTTRQSNTDSLHILSDSSGSQQSSFSTSSTFGTVCEEGALDLHTRNARNGKRSSVYNGVYFYVMSSIQEEKVFASHMKGLEAIDVLRLPGVQVPRTAKVFFLGLTIACIELRSLHAISIKGSTVTPVNSPTSPPNSTDMMGSSASTRVGTSAHGRIVSVMIARAYRLTGDPAILMYENGGGSLIVVDACGLLPALALAATSIKPWHTCRYETLVGYDFPKSIAGSLQGGQVAQPTSSASSTKASAPTTPYLQAVIHAALHYPKKKDALVGNLNFILAGNGLVGGHHHHLDDAFVCTSQPLLMQASTSHQQQQAVAIRIPRSTAPNAEFTAVIFNGILPLAFLEAFDSECTSTMAQFMSVQGGGGAVLTNDKRTISQRSFVSLMKRCGLGIHMLGKLWVISQNKSGDNGRALRCHVAIEMLARATKRILHNTLAKTISATPSKHKNSSPANPISHQTVVEVVLSVFRGVAEDGFREAELVPMVQTMFRDNNNGDGGSSGGMVPRVGKDVSYHTMLTRVEELTGIVTDNGSLQSIRPFCRVAKTGAFPVPMSSQEELRLCTVASKREDGMAGAATVCAVSFHRHNCQRIATVLDQLRGRAKFPTDPTASLSETASLMQMFVTMTELTLLTHALHAPTLPPIGGGSQQQHSTSIHNRIQWLLGAVSEERAAQYIKLTESSEHDKMFIAHFLLLLADRLLRNPPTVFQGALLVRQVLGLGLFQNSTQVHPVASRFLQESLHRVSIEACYGTNQIKEALAISKRWMRSSGALFGSTSEGYFEATRMMMVALIRSKKKKEATRMAQRQYDLAELVYGGKTSIHGVVLSAQQVVDLHCEVSAASMNNKPQNNSASRSERNSNSPSGHLSNSAGILRIASAANDLGSLTWRHAPICGLVHFRRAISIYNAVYGPDSKATATATYNIGLALLRLNLFGASQKHIQAARRTALNVDDERGLVQLCEASLKSLSLISATKIQRWYRSIKYGVAKSQTTKSQTDTATTFQSALSWSDELSEISGAGQS